MSEVNAHDATETCFRVKRDGEGYRIEWGDDPLNFIWQTEAQVEDFIELLNIGVLSA